MRKYAVMGRLQAMNADVVFFVINVTMKEVYPFMDTCSK